MLNVLLVLLALAVVLVPLMWDDPTFKKRTI